MKKPEVELHAMLESWQTSYSKLSETASTSDHSDAGGCMQAALTNIAPLGDFFLQFVVLILLLMIR